jgi:DNA polymerase elongation subunit (family B)
MTVWIKTRNGGCVKVIDAWRPFFYVSAPSERDLHRLTRHLSDQPVSYEYAHKILSLDSSESSRVLKVTVSDAADLRLLAGRIWRLGGYSRYRLWNVDIPPVQMYFYDRGLFPLAYVEARVGKEVTWRIMDSAERMEYQIPPLSTAYLKVKVEGNPAVRGFEDPIGEIRLEFPGDETVIIDSPGEDGKIISLVRIIREKDPDIIVTENGDSFLFTYLARRALKRGVLQELILGREKVPLSVQQRAGNTYFSYGRVYYRPAPQRLLGRLHIDAENSCLYGGYGLEGLIEIARTCRIPLHEASRASIGTCMSSAQLHQAVKDGFLVPWKKSEPENFKTAMDLLIADRGGFYFEPKIGIHDNVGEIDFSSMYPMLMMKKNISPETIACRCCRDSRNRVPELGYNICERRVGIVPKVLRLMLRKRFYYKAMREKAETPEERRMYDRRQAAYKIILCTCFGYLGYRNARFGKVDAHIAACAFARKTLLETARLAEGRGFEIVHGIVDSLYLKKEASDGDFIDLYREIATRTGLPISYEGRYRWIVFLSSKVHLGVPVLNRFYGVFQDGKLKVRGIEMRRRDSPKIVKRFQGEVLRELARAKNSREFFNRLPVAFKLFRRYAERIMNWEVNLEDLIISKQLSKDPDDYVNCAHQVIAARQLRAHGIEITAGQTVRYIILDADNRRPERRVKAAQLADGDRYDRVEYVKMLKESLRNILAPFEDHLIPKSQFRLDQALFSHP